MSHKKNKEEETMIKVVFWSQTGNTEAMANAVVEGFRQQADREKQSVSPIFPLPIYPEMRFSHSAVPLWEMKHWMTERWSLL